MSPLDFALYYASRGWRVVPIPPGEKFPKGIPDWQDKATTDETRIRRYWTLNPTHGVGIATGPETALFVVDIDPDDGGDDSLRVLEQQHGALPETIEAITGGGGRHLAFAWPEHGEIRNSASGVLGAGIDVRGVGGQFVVAPTIHPNGTPYAWEIEHDPFDGITAAPAPDWLLELLQRPITAAEPRRAPIAREKIGTLPGDEWAATTSWADQLTAAGATLHSAHHDTTGNYYELWTRPGKTVRDGASASLYYGGSDVLKVFTSNWAPLRPESTYTLWGFHVETEHGGEFQAAARAQRRSMTSTSSGFATPDEAGGNEGIIPSRPPDIVWNGRQLDDITAAATGALIQHNTPPSLFVRAGQLSRLRQDEEQRPIIEGLRNEHVRLALSDAANWWRANKDGERTATSPPLDVCASILARGEWTLPPLAGVVELPVLRPDGTFAVEHGYDAQTRLYHWHRGDEYPAVPETPTCTELAAAVALVDEMLCDFPWDSTADRANAWGLLLTPLVRPLVGQVPMALVDAPEPGTGKGLLVQVAATITIGRSASLMAWPSSDEELEKKVTAALMAGNTMMIFDNVEGVIKSPTLAAVLTADSWQGRVLGRSEMVMVPNRATWACTGNNLDVGGDLARRCYRIRLDAHQAQPWKRTGFRHADLAGWVAENRLRILHALCTVVRSWWVAARPDPSTIVSVGGYTAWSRTVGGILEHAGVCDFLANLAAFHAEADQEAQSWEGFLTEWHNRVGEDVVTVGDIVSKLGDIYTGSAWRELLPSDLAGHWDKPTFTRQLGMALRRRAGRHHGETGVRIIDMPRDRRRVAMYSATMRSAALEPARDLNEVPRAKDLVADQERGTAGPPPLATRETKLSTGNEGSYDGDPNRSRESRGPALYEEPDW